MPTKTASAKGPTATRLLSRFTTQQLEQISRTKRITKARPKPAPRRAPTAVPRKPIAVRKEPQPVTGNDLLQARDYADRARLKARSICRAVRNASTAEVNFCKLLAKLPSRRPTESSTLREWRAYTAAVQALKPAILKTGVCP